MVVVLNPGQQTDNCVADAITSAYLNINMIDVACTCVGYQGCTHLAVAYWYFRSHIKCYCLPRSLMVRLTFTFSIYPLCSNTKFCSLYSR